MIRKKNDDAAPFQVNILLKTSINRFDLITDKAIGNWKILRSRKDKTYPNGLITALSVYKTIFEEYIS